MGRESSSDAFFSVKNKSLELNKCNLFFKFQVFQMEFGIFLIKFCTNTKEKTQYVNIPKIFYVAANFEWVENDQNKNGVNNFMTMPSYLIISFILDGSFN